MTTAGKQAKSLINFMPSLNELRLEILQSLTVDDAFVKLDLN